MPTIYCSECHAKVTMHADCNFACECQGPVELRDGGDPLPDSWRGHQMDADETWRVLSHAADEERHYTELEASIV
jgi:hypothetical protein